MSENPFELKVDDYGWCPGCGNFPILETLKESLHELGWKPNNTVLVSGIGQAAKTPHYININFFAGLHGRSLPVAMAIKSLNPDLNVIVESGDGCTYAEGGNHLIHAMRRNINITNIVHDNQVYGLTKGQASPTTMMGMKTTLQFDGVIVGALNPIALAIALDAGFVARAYCADKEQTKKILKEALTYKGYAHVDIYQPCVSFNRINTYQWYKEHTYYLEDSHDPTNKAEALKRSIESTKLPLGVFYKSDRPSFEEKLNVYQTDKTPVMKRKRDLNKLAEKLKSFI